MQDNYNTLYQTNSTTFLKQNDSSESINIIYFPKKTKNTDAIALLQMQGYARLNFNQGSNDHESKI